VVPVKLPAAVFCWRLISLLNSDIKNSRYLLLILALFLVALAGYLGYVLYPRFDLPAVSGSGLLLLAAAAGLASFFSPCSFPLLATLLARQVRDAEQGQAWARLLRSGAALALGATLFLLLAGAAIALGAASLFARVTFTSTAGRIIRATVGGLLILLGVLQWQGVSPGSGMVFRLFRPLAELQARWRRQRPTLAFGLFGFAYILGGFG